MIYPSLAAQAPVLVSKAPSLARIWARRLKRGLRRRLLDFDPTPGVNA
jgi:hypothetical protein